MSKTIKKKKARKSLAGLSLDFKQADEFYKTGVAYHRKGILDEAISCYNSAIKLNPKHDMALYCLGIAMQEKDCLDEAIDCYERSLNLNPNNAMAHNNLGFILEKRIGLKRQYLAMKKHYKSIHSLILLLIILGTPIVRATELMMPLFSTRRR